VTWHLAQRTGDAFHMTRHVLGDPLRRSEVTTFVVTKRSIFRLRLPNHELLDVDMSLFNGTLITRPLTPVRMLCVW
jgi:hypothetical protein